MLTEYCLFFSRAKMTLKENWKKKGRGKEKENEKEESKKKKESVIEKGLRKENVKEKLKGKEKGNEKDMKKKDTPGMTDEPEVVQGPGHRQD